MKIAWLQVFLALILGFAAGLVFEKGLIPGCHCFKKHCCQSKENVFKKNKLEKFSKELSLTEDQRTKVAAIFEAKHSDMKKLREEISPQFEAIKKSAHEKINKLLTPEQQAKFEKFEAKIGQFHGKCRKCFDD